MKITIPESSGYVTECPVTLDGETRVFPVGVEIDVPEAWASVINDMLNSQKKESAKPYVNPEMKSYVDAKDSEQKTYIDAVDNQIASGKGSAVYSSSEIEVGKWIDNSKVYKKTYSVSLADAEAAAQFTVAIDNSPIDKCVGMEGIVVAANGNVVIPGNVVAEGSDAVRFGLTYVHRAIGNTDVVFGFFYDNTEEIMSYSATAYVTVYYTKAS